MKRRRLVRVGCLVLSAVLVDGAIVVVAALFGATSGQMPLSSVRMVERVESDRRVVGAVMSRGAVRHCVVREASGSAEGVERPVDLPPRWAVVPERGSGMELRTYAMGWPWASWRGVEVISRGVGGQDRALLWLDRHRIRALPLEPLVVGVVLNGVVWAAVVGTIVVGVRWVW